MTFGTFNADKDRQSTTMTEVRQRKQAAKPFESGREQFDADDDKDRRRTQRLPSASAEFPHTYAIHKQGATSVLSEDNPEKVSFRGFANLASRELKKLTPCSDCPVGSQFTVDHGELQQGSGIFIDW